MQSLEVIHNFFSKLCTVCSREGAATYLQTETIQVSPETTTKLATITAPVKNNYQFNILV